MKSYFRSFSPDDTAIPDLQTDDPKKIRSHKQPTTSSSAPFLRIFQQFNSILPFLLRYRYKITASILHLPVIKIFFFFVKSVHHRHDRTAMNDKRRIFHMSGNQKSDLFFHSFHTALSEFFLILSSRKRRYPSAFQPLYISGVLFQLLICFSLKLSEITLSHQRFQNDRTP